MHPLTPDQLETVHGLQREIKDLHLEADEHWAAFIRTGDEECYNSAHALDGERAMMQAIAYVPKWGERKMSKVRKALEKVRGNEIAAPNVLEARLQVLENINLWREGYGLPPLDRLPAGIPGDSHRCVIAKAITMTIQEKTGSSDVRSHVPGSDGMSATWWDAETGLWNTEDTSMLHGTWASDLINSFDNHEYVDLIEYLGKEAERLWSNWKEEHYAGGGDYYVGKDWRAGHTKEESLIEFLNSGALAPLVQENKRRNEAEDSWPNHTDEAWEIYAMGGGYYVPLTKEGIEAFHKEVVEHVALAPERTPAGIEEEEVED